MERVFLFAGESSGDLHGAALLEQWRSLSPNTLFEGVGGPRMRAQALSCVLPMEEFQVMGFTDVFRALPRLVRHMNQIVSHILQVQPKIVLLIDYPGFNLRLARRLRKKGYRGKIVQYICPKVWAWGSKRIHLLEKYFDLLLTIFPFEKGLFASSTLQVEYVGHPLVERIANHSYDDHWRKKVGLPAGPFVALFPGSRPAEIRRNGPLLLSAAEQYAREHPHIPLAVSCGQESLRPSLLALLSSSTIPQSIHVIPPENHYDMMREAHFALAKSGTVTVELALHATPTIVFFVVNPLNRWLIRFFLRPRLPYFCMANILMKREIFPEWIAKPFTSHDLFTSMTAMHRAEVHAQCQQECRTLQSNLGAGNHTQRVLEALSSL